MANMFLSIDGVNVSGSPPYGIESGNYTAYEQELGVNDRMISGRYVEELRGRIWVVEVSYNSIDDETLTELQTALHSTRKHELFFLPSTGGTEVKSGYFALTTLPQPSLSSFITGSTPLWSGFTLHFEEIDSHD